MLKKLTDQLDALRSKELEEKRLTEKDGRIMVRSDKSHLKQRQQSELQAVHEARVLETKHAAQREIRADLDSINKERIERKTREAKAALALDMRIVKEFMAQDSVDKESKNRKKDELRTEMPEYKSYLEQMRAYEKMRDEELNAMYRSEEERIWNVKDAKWQKY
jgi:hypothetical protein